ncbi:MAG: MarR family transcriptional regulator [Herbaspirillum sp.]|nr:MarR family transcriptional regulator [Herbaspirillum sp.]
MDIFESTEKRMQQIKQRIPDFPLEMMRLMRMTYHIQKSMRDVTNAVLKEHDLHDGSYIVLAVLYGSEDETSTASTLGQACHEKPANLTRVCNDLAARGLITRGARPGDRRSVMISLTKKGRDLIKTVLPAVWQSTVRTYDGFSAAEMKQLEAMSVRQLRNMAD